MKKIAILTVFLTYLFNFTPILGQVYQDHFSADFFENQRFAHRGGYANGPENTINTIVQNIRSGVNAIEIDVMITKDSQLVVFHDYTIGRLLNSANDYSVAELSLEEIKSFALRDTSNGYQYVCSLQELLDTLTPIIKLSSLDNFILEIDFKPHGDQTQIAVKALLETIKKPLKQFGDIFYNHFFVSTYYPEMLKELQYKNTSIVTAFAVHNTPKDNKLKAKLAIMLAPYFIRKHKVKIIEPNLCMVSDKFVRKWHKRGILINTYTANTACEKEYIEKYKIAYTTNCPNSNCPKDDSGQKSKPKKWCKSCENK